jgi:hypothetical protein
MPASILRSSALIAFFGLGRVRKKLTSAATGGGVSFVSEPSLADGATNEPGVCNMNQEMSYGQYDMNHVYEKMKDNHIGEVPSHATPTRPTGPVQRRKRNPPHEPSHHRKPL